MEHERPRLYVSRGNFELCCHESPATRYPEETHATVQVCIPLGDARYVVERTSQTGTRIVQRLHRADVLVVPAGQPHAVNWLAPAGVAMLHLTEAFIVRALDASALRLPDVLTLRDPFLTHAAAQVRAEWNVEGTLSPAFSEAIATIVACRIAAGHAGRPIAQPKPRAFSDARGARLERFIDDHLDRPISLADLAEYLSLSKWQFIRSFRASMGVAPHRWITERRLARAQTLLARSALSITAIALEVGMSHSHFSRTFQRRFGVTPFEYRRQRRT